MRISLTLAGLRWLPDGQVNALSIPANFLTIWPLPGEWKSRFAWAEPEQPSIRCASINLCPLRLRFHEPLLQTLSQCTWWHWYKASSPAVMVQDRMNRLQPVLNQEGRCPRNNYIAPPPTALSRAQLCINIFRNLFFSR